MATVEVDVSGQEEKDPLLAPLARSGRPRRGGVPVTVLVKSTEVMLAVDD
jgi:hypothetical protein